MKKPLLALYHFFEGRKALLYGITAGLFVLLGAAASQLRLEEDIARMLPDSEQTQQINDIFRHARFTDKIIVKIKALGDREPESLAKLADSLAAQLQSEAGPLVAEVKTQVSDETTLDIYRAVRSNLPVYLEAEDYATIDSLIAPAAVRDKLQENYNTLTSASGMMMQRLIADDPVGITSLALRRLQSLQVDESFDLYDGYIMDKAHRGVFVFITPIYNSSETGKNEALIAALDKSIDDLKTANAGIDVLYYGGTAVAVGNSRQLKRDTILTLSITVVAILLLIGFFFRRKRAPFVMMLPVLFGGLFALAIIALVKGSISTISIAAGSIVLGIAVNYSLHFFTHYKHCGSIEETIADLIKPMTIGSFTTVGSFFCLMLLQSQILNDFGLFAGLSLTGATIFALVFLPHFIPQQKESTTRVEEESRWMKLPDFRVKYAGAFFLLILVLTVVLFHYAKQVGFESDMNRFNYMDDKMLRAQREIDRMQDDTSKTVFIASTGKTTEAMLQNNEALMKQLSSAEKKGWVKKYSSFSSFIPSQHLQQEKLDRWNNYWTSDKKQALMEQLRKDGAQLKFSAAAFTPFDSLLHKEYSFVKEEDLEPIKTAFGNEYLLESGTEKIIINAVTVDKAHRPQLYAALGNNTSTVILDKQIITNKFIGVIYSDFNSILIYTSLLVFFSLLISYGRLELTLITFLPMVISWIWILGIMGLVGLKFNIINIIISTFIFGLGDDFSIFISDGLTRKFREGKEMLANHKVSIFLSAATTIIGLGALIFAKHPALKSIALISIIGILCVVFIGQTVQPFLYNFFIQSRKDRGLPPWTITTLILFFIAFTYFVSVSLLVSLVGYILLYLVPYPNKKKRKLFFHYLICNALKVLTYMMVNVRKTHEGRSNMDFSKPALIIVNHASFLDILVTVMQHPKLILLTNKWVYYSPVFGKVVQLADYYPVMEGVDPATEKFVDIVKDGYSIVIFPEGTRSPDGRLKRFHKGAFYLAEQLGIDIVPMLLHGTGDTIRKGDFMVMNASMTMKFLPRISPQDVSFGKGYAERTKTISRYFKSEFEKLREEKEVPRYFRQRLCMNYIYKGAALEWLALKESRNEKFYEELDKLLPKTGHITEIGCGYGFHIYMFHFTGWNRTLTGCDSSEEKIDVANNCFSKNEKITFIAADLPHYTPAESDAIIINEKELALPAEEVDKLEQKCFQYLKENGVVIRITAEGKIKRCNPKEALAV